MKHEYFSIGEYCVTAHQIRRVTGSKEAYLFDWLVTREDNFNFIEKKDDSFLIANSWEITDNGLRLRDAFSNLLFQHEFEVDKNKKIIHDKVIHQINNSRKKYLYLKYKTIKKISESERPVIIRSENNINGVSDAFLRLNSMREVFSKLNNKTKFIVTSTFLTEEKINNEFLFLKIKPPVVSDSENAWKGHDSSWQRVFDIAESTF